MADLFGLEREARIIRSGIREHFMPHKPIDSERLFFGRQTEVHRLLECMGTPGLHALLFGERGVGKSSLANIALHVLLSKLAKAQPLLVRCDSQSTFASVATAVLNALGIEATQGSRTLTTTEGGNAQLGVPGLAQGQVQSIKTNTDTRPSTGVALTPAGVSAAIAAHRGLVVVIDECDAIQQVNDRQAVAELVKLLSDAGSEVKLFIVGIASTSAELVAGHPSVHRCLREVELHRMSDIEIRSIVEGNAKECELTFDEEVVNEIVELSAGYPHFAQLLALGCAENAVAEERRRIEPHDMQASLATSMQNAEGSLRRSYEDATRSATTDKFRTVVHAAGVMARAEFTAAQWRAEVAQRLSEPVNQNELNNYLARLVSDDGSRIVRRVSKGVYRFSDPRMKSYVRIAERRRTAARG